MVFVGTRDKGYNISFLSVLFERTGRKRRGAQWSGDGAGDLDPNVYGSEFIP